MITNQKLETALRILENFTQKNTSPSKGSSFQKIFSLIKTSLSGKTDERQKLIEKSEVSFALKEVHTYKLKTEKAPVQIGHQLPPNVLDPFRTKAISLLKDRGIFPSVKEILESVKNTPIETVETDSTITLTQKLSETIIIHGVFERHPNGSRPKSFSINFSDSSSGDPLSVAAKH